MATVQWNTAQTVYQGQPNYQTQSVPLVPVNFPGQPILQLQAMSLDQPDYQQGHINSQAEQNFYGQPIQQIHYQGQPYPQQLPNYQGIPHSEARPAYPT